MEIIEDNSILDIIMIKAVSKNEIKAFEWYLKSAESGFQRTIQYSYQMVYLFNSNSIFVTISEYEYSRVSFFCLFFIPNKCLVFISFSFKSVKITVANLKHSTAHSISLDNMAVLENPFELPVFAKFMYSSALTKRPGALYKIPVNKLTKDLGILYGSGSVPPEKKIFKHLRILHL